MNTPSHTRVSSPITTSRLTRRQALIRGGASLTTGALLASGRAKTTEAQTPTSRVRADDFSGLIDVGGRLLYFEALGKHTNNPTVVFEAGGLGRSDVWSRDLREPAGTRQMVFQGVAEFAHVCTYDRPGTIGEVNPDLDPFGPLFYPSRSDPVPMPRVIQDIAHDLENVLKHSGETGPYVLVGHSMGGLIMRYFAMTRPEDVVGLVLVDSNTEETWDRFRAALSPDDWAVFEQMTVDKSGVREVYPEAEAIWQAPLADDPTVAEVRRVRTKSPLKPLPMVVLSHGIPFGQPFPNWHVDLMEQIMTDLQVELVNLVPGSKHIIAEQSGHNIHQDQPDLVINAVRMVVDAVRDPSSWTS